MGTPRKPLSPVKRFAAKRKRSKLPLSSVVSPPPARPSAREVMDHNDPFQPVASMFRDSPPWDE